MRVLMTGGGTGGHIYPALAIADEIRTREPDAEILFIGTERGLERDIVPESGYEIQFIEASGFNRKKPLKNFKTIKNLIMGSKKIKKILDEFMPDIVIGTGGYVTGAVVREAAKKGIRTYIHEQNAFPGMTNKILEKYVNKVFLGFEEAGKYFKNPEKHVYTGNPVREIFTKEKENYKKQLGFKEESFLITGFGGSLGAPIINNEMIKVVKTLHDVDDMEFVIITGKRNFKEVIAELEVDGFEFMEKDGYKISGNLRVLEYAKDLPEYMLASELLITRAGALTVAEIAAAKKVSILIPSPNVTGNHQYHNAKVLADKGAAILLEEKNIGEDSILDAVSTFKMNSNELDKIINNCENLKKVNATGVIYDNIV